MGIILRSGFWFSMAALALPVGYSASDGESQVGPLQAIFAAKEAVSDVTSLCERKPDVCKTGRVAASTIAARAQESARLAMNLMDSDAAKQAISLAKGSGSVDSTLKTGSIPVPTPRASVVALD